MGTKLWTPQEKARLLRPLIEKAVDSLDDEDAIEATELFEKWVPDADYSVGDRRRYGGVLYRCLQAHHSIETWNPVDAVSLWTKVLIPDPEVIYDWEQPDSTNPYMTGDKVRHNGSIWISTIDNNVWEPGVYGWDLVE